MRAEIIERVVVRADMPPPVIHEFGCRDIVIAGKCEERHFEFTCMAPELFPFCRRLHRIAVVALDKVADHDCECGTKPVDLFDRLVEDRPVLVAAACFITDHDETETILIFRPSAIEERFAFRIRHGCRVRFVPPTDIRDRTGQRAIFCDVRADYIVLTRTCRHNGKCEEYTDTFHSGDPPS